MNRTVRTILAAIILLATVGAFTYYLVKHPETFTILTSISPVNLAAIFVLYVLSTFAVALILLSTVRLCNYTLGTRDGVLLTMWSSIINFFGPLQSGPAFRGLYLKKAHGISLKNYGVATLLYYAFYAIFSGLFLLSGVLDWWFLIGLSAVGIIAVFLLLKLPLSAVRSIRSLPLNQTYKLALATLFQLVLVAAIYTIELKSLDNSISIRQTIAYAGAANFALFVSITPGAIGFREAFLVFSQDIHHISPNLIVTANIIDRAAYVLLLGVLFVIAVSIHAKDRLVAETAAKKNTE